MKTESCVSVDSSENGATSADATPDHSLCLFVCLFDGLSSFEYQLLDRSDPLTRVLGVLSPPSRAIGTPYLKIRFLRVREKSMNYKEYEL